MPKQQYIEVFEQCRGMIDSFSSPVLNSKRDEAFACFKTNALPTKKVERYKYTDIPQMLAPDYGLNLNRLEIPVNPYDAFKCDVPNLSTLLYFIVNDQFYDKALPKASLPEGVFIGSLKEFSEQNPEIASIYYGEIAAMNNDVLHKKQTAESEEQPKSKDILTALNTMFCQDGLMVYVPKGVKMEKTVQVINILRSDVPMMVNRRVLVVVEEDAEAKLLFCDHAADDREFLTTQVVEANVAERAHLEMYCLEETHYKNNRISNVYIRQEADSTVHHNVITLHNGNTRNQLDLQFAGEGAECFLNGCVIADKKQHVDNNTVIDHAVGHCTSHQLYKYVLDDESTGAFAGRILVRKDAQKTSSEETNRNLCCTKQARMWTQPMLEIYADDVKCSHGSTVGQLNDQALFYMRQRGISEKEAKTLLQQAFVYEVIDQITLTPLRDRLHYLVEKRFRGELNKCEGCKLCK